jgi:flagellar biogenesis protein FliO
MRRMPDGFGPSLRAIVIVAALLAGLSLARAEGSVFDDRPLQRPAPATQSAAGQPADTGRLDLGMARVALSLGGVIVLIFLLRWAGRKYLRLPADGKAAGPIQVLSRMTIAPRQQLLLIQAGRRVILAASTGTQTNPLCEIRDQEEIAELKAQLQGRPASSFGSLFGRASKSYEEEPPADPSPERPETQAADDSTTPATPELQGLVEKVRTMSRDLGRM